MRSKSSHSRIPNLSTINYRPGLKGDNIFTEEYLYSWKMRRSMQPGSIKMTSFDFTKPTASVQTTWESKGNYTNNDLQIYEFYESFKSGEEDTVGYEICASKAPVSANSR